MSIVKTGTLTVGTGGVAQNLNLGFIPNTFYMRNDTIMSSGNGAGETMTGVVEVWWDDYLGGLSSPYTLINTTTDGVPTYTRLASGTVASTTGVVAFQTTDPMLFTPDQAPYNSIAGNRAYIQESTNLVITGISNAANASVTATHSFTSADIGVTVVSFHGVLGMTQINNLQGVITGVTSTTSFTVNINTVNFGTYSAGVAGVTGGFANVITGAPVNTIYGNQSLPTSEQNLGIIGLRLGTTIMVNTSDVWYYQAVLNYPGLS
jgi:hypothetical protein